MMRGSPLLDQKMRGSWKPGMSGNADQAPVHERAGVGGMLTFRGGLVHLSPPLRPSCVRSDVVHSWVSEGKT